MLFISCFCHAFASVHCCLVVTCWERADLLALVCDVCCDCVTFPFGILGLVCYLIVLIPDPYHLSYFDGVRNMLALEPMHPDVHPDVYTELPEIILPFIKLK